MNWWHNWQNRRTDRRAVRQVVSLHREWGGSARVSGDDRHLAELQAAAERAASRSRWGRKADAQVAAAHLARQRAADQTHRQRTAQLQAQRERAAREREAARRPIFKIGTVRDEPSYTVVEGWVFGCRPGEPEGPVDVRDFGWSVSELRQIAREAREYQAAQDPGPEAEAGA